MNQRITLSPMECKASGINHRFVVDTSGSMSRTLPKLRAHLKNRLAVLVKPEDTVTIVYFSGRGQSGIVVENHKVSDVSDLQQVQSAVDRFLKPMGMTAFIDPLVLVRQAINRTNNGADERLYFMTDGYDNQYNDLEIISEFQKISDAVQSITILEYGWYCNRELLSRIAQATGASHVFSEDYEELEQRVEQTFSQPATPCREVIVADNSVVIYLNAVNELISVTPDGNKVKIPGDVNEIYVIPAAHDNHLIYNDFDLQTLLATLYYSLKIMNTDLTWKVVLAIGDKRLLNKFSTCFTKQDYSSFAEFVKAAFINPGIVEFGEADLNSLSSTPSVVEILETLCAGDNYIRADSVDWQYNRIGKKMVQKEDTVVNDLAEQMQSVSSVEDIKTIAKQIADHETWVPEFVADDSTRISLAKLVFSESRPNISLQTTVQGTVAIPESKVTEFGLPSVMQTWITRNYNIVKDGIINTKVLPLEIDQATHDKLVALGVIESGEMHPVINLMDYPLLKYADAVDQDAPTTFYTWLKLQSLKARQKVLKYYRDQLTDTKKSAGYAALYGDEAGQWLYSIGLRDYGFTPPVAAAEPSGDVYYSRELNIKAKGLSSLPSLSAVAAKVKKGSALNAGDMLINRWVEHYEPMLEGIMSDTAKEMLIAAETKAVIAAVRDMQTQLNRIMYSIMVGKRWFVGHSVMEETSETIVFDGMKITVSAVVEQKEIKL